MSQNAKQFLQFIAATLILAWLGGQVAGAGLPKEFAVPFLVLWIAAFLAAIGYIIAGKEGMVALLRMVGTFWIAIVCIAVPIGLLSLLFAN